MAYRNTLQADALQLVAKKLQSSLAVEGELPEDGLAAYGDDGDDLMLALARKIVAGEEDANSVESVFAQAQQVAAEAEALLVDAEWRAPEPVAAEAVAITVDADDAGAPQRTLFSWAEFIAGKQDEPPKRQRRDEAPTLSLFEWALEREREGTGETGRHDRLRSVASAREAVALCANGFPRFPLYATFLRSGALPRRRGELPADGFAAYGDGGGDLMLALARRIVAGEEDANSVELFFAPAGDVVDGTTSPSRRRSATCGGIGGPRPTSLPLFEWAIEREPISPGTPAVTPPCYLDGVGVRPAIPGSPLYPLKNAEGCDPIRRPLDPLDGCGVWPGGKNRPTRPP